MVSGKNDTSYSGLVNYYGTYYYVENGVLNWDYSGLTKYYDTWYYVENSELKWNYTGLTKYYGTWYYVETVFLIGTIRGSLATTAHGITSKTAS